MSVDTTLRGKNTAKYRRVRHGDVEILVSPALRKVARRASLDVSRGLLGKRFDVEVVLR